jgi:N-acetylglutamate synthase-like GNAT family acetyltransferase
MQIVKLKEHMEYVPELVRLHREEWGYLRPDESEAEHVARVTEICLAPHMPELLVALDAGILVGSAGLKARDSLLPDLDFTPWLFAVYVKATYRSQGVAALLIREVEKIARQLDFPELYLCTRHQEAYYARLGYGTLQHADCGVEIVAVMVKSLLT